ncbi:glycosyltransferase [Hoeflea sp.]|uniref:glycosyltransferase n=1 Tax=Hoeflea sp. TaxID=1940281 RepID=UPI003B021914
MKSSAGRGHALLSYINEGVTLPEDDPFFNGHTNKWECRQIAHLLVEAGYTTDVIDFRNKRFVPEKQYDVVIDIHHNLQRLAPDLPPECKKVLHATGSYVPHLNKREAERLADLRDRRGIVCRPRRSGDGGTLQASLETCDFVSLIGNAVTRSTYPMEQQTKITCINATASNVFDRKIGPVPQHREFIWFGGGGAVLKGLDLVLEAFDGRRDVRLNVVGGPGGERDFLKAFKRQLFETDNITFHGFLEPTSPEFCEVAERCIAAIKPSASEGMSTAVTTTMSIGLIPIISRQTGIDLPRGSGFYLEALTSDKIIEAVDATLRLTDLEVQRQMESVQAHAQEAYSRERFRENYVHFLTEIVGA